MAVLLYLICLVLIVPAVLIAALCLVIEKMTEAVSIWRFLWNAFELLVVILNPPVLVALIVGTMLSGGLLLTAAWMPEYRPYGYLALFLVGASSLGYSAYWLANPTGAGWLLITFPSIVAVCVAGYQSAKAILFT